MFLRPFVFVLCLVLLCVWGLFGNLAENGNPVATKLTGEKISPRLRGDKGGTSSDSSKQSERRGASQAATDISSDFYQTIIKNNLFAPLGTDLHAKHVPGAGVKLIATFTRKDPSDATAIVENTATGEQKTVGVGSTIAGYSVLEIQAKQVLIQKAGGAPAIWKRMNHFLLY